MANMSLKKVAMPEQDPNVRNKNFEEVALGYTKEMAMEEAARCLNCKNKPCVGGCPVNVPIPAFIEKVAAGDFEGAYEVITTENALPAICLVGSEMCIRDSRRTSVKENVSVVSRESLLVLDVWNVSSQTGIWQTPKKQKLILRRTE